MDSKAALALTDQAYPEGPEALARVLNVTVEYEPLQGCEGWCVNGHVRRIVVVNALAPKSRQRFTLAHELAHLVCETATDVALQPFQSEEDEEREANALAARFLFPDARLKALRSDVPLDGEQIHRIAAAAGISPTMLAYRFAEAPELLGIESAAVARFEGDNVFPYPVGRPLPCERFRVLRRAAGERAIGQSRTTCSGGVTDVATLFGLGNRSRLLVLRF